MVSNQVEYSSDYPTIENAKAVYAQAMEEFASGDWIRQKDGCEKGYRAATEALDVYLVASGYQINVGQPEAHWQRNNALEELIQIDPRNNQISYDYGEFKSKLHGTCFYTNVDPKRYEQRLLKVKDFIELIEESL